MYKSINCQQKSDNKIFTLPLQVPVPLPMSNKEGFVCLKGQAGQHRGGAVFLPKQKSYIIQLQMT